MAQDATTAPAHGHLAWKPGSLCCLANAAALKDAASDSPEVLQGFDTKYPEGPVAHFPVVNELTALGVRVDAAASAGCSIEARIIAAQKHFWARRDQLLCRQVSLRARLSRLY